MPALVAGLCALTLAAAAMSAKGEAAQPQFAVDPHQPGPDLPHTGRSLFDFLAARPDGSGYHIPFPFKALLEKIERLTDGHAYFDSSIAGVLIPHGRSLQRDAAAPDYYRFPRVVIAVDAEPVAAAGAGGMLLKHRLYLGYQEKANLIEVISYNEAAARFEFQIVDDYRAGGTPTIRYASRTLCTACHQNAAPIFARPLWDESNANRVIAARLRQENRAFYGLPVDQSIDVAYAIDNATDRANRFAVTQRVWTDGCGPAAESQAAACRRTLLAMALQYRLSGRRHFDTKHADYQRGARPRLTQRWQRLWPDGLGLPNADVPNRRLRSLEQTDIPAFLEPLRLRAPSAVWHFDNQHDQRISDIVAGIGDFIAAIDVQRLDRLLAAAIAQSRTLTAQCSAQADTRWPSAGEVTLRCRDASFSLDARLQASADGALSGAITRLQLGTETYVDLPVDTATVSSDGSIEFAPRQPYNNLSLRRANGDAVRTVRVVFAADTQPGASVSILIHEDFALVSKALQDMEAHALTDADAALGSGPLERSAVFDELFTALGLPAVAWCCQQSSHLPAAVGPDTALVNSTQGDRGALGLLQKHCASCHATASEFPPNFLAGNAERRVAQCAERIAYRLSMWYEPEHRRGKTPMPPDSALVRNAISTEQWLDSSDLKTLSAYARRVANAGDDDIPQRAYNELRPCLATSPAKGGS